jgi:hypothetical protein
MDKRIVDYLPALYEGILPAFFHRRIPEETLATCDDCAMCRKAGQPRLPSTTYFRPDAKCCTFFPSLPNYLVGGLLAGRGEGLAEGRRRARELIEAGEGVGPRGVGATPTYDRRYEKLSERGFGRMRGLLCPYFALDSRNCTIWPHRNSVCATYYCRHVRGIPGSGFWSALNRYLGTVEEALASYALLRLGWPADRILAASAGRDRQTSPASGSARLRSPWDGSEKRAEAVYLRAYRIVRVLRPPELKRIGGVKLEITLRAVEECFYSMRSTSLPERMQLNGSLRVSRRGEQMLIEVPGHSSYALAAPIWEALARFRGHGENSRVTARLRQETGLDVSRGFLLALYRGGILTSAE